MKALEETLAKREAALKEERTALQLMRTENDVSSEGEIVAVEGAQEEISQIIGSEVVKIVKPDPVVPPQEYVPRRPQVFDGGNREPVVPKDTTIGVTRPLYFSDPSSATGRTPSTDGRDVRPPLSPTVPNARRFADLKPQHVVSFRANRDG